MRRKISIVIPIHKEMRDGPYFLWRCIQSIMEQSFKDYEIIITQDGKMAENTNAGILKARGELVKILYMDDYLAHKDALRVIVNAFDDKDRWLVTGCLHRKREEVSQPGEIRFMHDETPHSPHLPSYNDEIYTGRNSIGSPSVLTFRREGCLLFDTTLSWLLDCDLYKRLHDAYGLPKIVNDLNVVIGLHDGQTSNLMGNEEKTREYEYTAAKFS